MSGNDEIPNTAVEKQRAAINACPECGYTQWKQVQKFSSMRHVDILDRSCYETDAEWYSCGDWECAGCGAYASQSISEELDDVL